MSNILAGKLALITGASRGIGAAVARRYAQEGANLILVATDIQKLEALDDELAQFNVNVTLAPIDLQDSAKIESLGHSIAERFGKLDILVGNAGKFGVLSPINHLDESTWKSIFDINFHANWSLIKALHPLLRESSAGRAIFVTSSYANEPEPYWSAYSASKAALENMVKTYAKEVENICPNLKINLIDPGAVRTDLYTTAYPGDKSEVAKPEDVAETFVNLAKADLSVTGTIVVC